MRNAVGLIAVVLGAALLLACGGPSPTGAPAPDLPAADAPRPGIVFVSERDGNQELYLIQPDGSGLTRLTDHPAVDADPAWSPDGRQIAFRSRRHGSSDIFILAADGSGLVNLARDPEDSLDDEFAPAWSPAPPDGGGVLGEQTLALSTDRFYLGGCSPHQIALLPLSGGAENIRLLGVLEGNQRTMAWAPALPDGGLRLVFSSHCNTSDINLYLWDWQTKRVQKLTDDPAPDLYPAWSPNVRCLAFQSNRDGNAEIYLLELESGALTNLTHHPASDSQPTWSPALPDGGSICGAAMLAFVSDRDGNDEIYTLNADGSNPRNLTRHPARDFWPAWSPAR